MKDNKGFSLVELMVVIVILGIMVSAAAVSLSFLSDTNADGAAEKLTATLTKARRLSQAKEEGNIYMKIKGEGDSFYAVIYEREGLNWKEETRQELCNNSLEIKVNDTVLAPDGEYSFSFRKSVGSLNEDVSSITITGKVSKVITVIKETGRCIYERN